MSGQSLSLLPILATAAVFLVMLAVGLGITLRETWWVWERPGLLVRGLLSVLVLVPLTGVAIARALSLPRWLEVGVALMAISPGAPVALRRSLGAGGHATFGPVLQVFIALAAVIVVPLWVVVLNPLYAGTRRCRGSTWRGRSGSCSCCRWGSVSARASPCRGSPNGCGRARPASAW
jgi:BASS family bile acid:Na+ symporter